MSYRTRRRGELLHHGHQQLAVALVQIRGVAPDLRQKTQLVVGEILRVHLAGQCVAGEELRDGQVEGVGDLGQRIQRGHGVAVFHARKIAAQQAGSLFDVSL